ncbi:MAG TPA: TIGR03118 family protein [Terriglobales bacterium]|jgi:uncharacterized protein (TIGR03118 family)|nr:TIGR03118 family protein [Terriglobales bacterium]
MNIPRLSRLKPLAVGFVAIVLSTLVFGQHYTETDLVSDVPGAPGQTPIIDPNLQNPWGLVSSPTSPWWVSNNNSGTSTLYSIDAAGVVHIVPINAPKDLVAVPNAPSQPAPGTPTGIMFNGSNDFQLTPGNPAAFIFVTEDGTVQGWAGGPTATIKVDHSQVPDAANGAVYKGATIAEIDGNKFILAANFRSGRVDVFDTNFKQVKISEEAFDDDRIPRDFAPFNVQAIGPNIYVTYAKQDAPKHDPVGGTGFGFVAVFNSHGRMLTHLQHGPWFNAPWGVVLTTEHFGEFSHTLLVGNFRGGTIAAFNPLTGRFLGNVLKADGTTLTIDGLWALRFGNDHSAGPATTLFFTAGINGEKDGLFGTLTPVAPELREDDEQ